MVIELNIGHVGKYVIYYPCKDGCRTCRMVKYLTAGKRYFVHEARGGVGNWVFISNDEGTKYKYSAKHFEMGVEAK